MPSLSGGIDDFSLSSAMIRATCVSIVCLIVSFSKGVPFLKIIPKSARLRLINFIYDQRNYSATYLPRGSHEKRLAPFIKRINKSADLNDNGRICETFQPVIGPRTGALKKRRWLFSS